MASLLLLGSTGSIGTQTLDLLRSLPTRHTVFGLAAQRSWGTVLAQAREFEVPFVALTDLEAAAAIRAQLPPTVHVFSGPDAHAEIAREIEYDIALHGVVGAAGLPASVQVLERGKTLALANKESLVIAGEALMRIARENGGTIVPVDSEHSAVFQCLRGEDIGRVRRILLTASGGPFRATDPRELAHVTPAMALKHPNWNMGPRITIGSATLMNKALEVIELHHLFGLERERIEVVIHPQSIVHSLVEFVDGSVIAQMGPPDMRGPIHYALHHPERVPNTLRGFDFASFAQLTFEKPDPARFPALDLGPRCVEEGGDAGAVLNAADEVAVGAFLEGRIGFLDIPRINRAVLDRRPGGGASVEELLRSDAKAREMAAAEVQSPARSPIPSGRGPAGGR
ncbi:MAG: 1-deoxy-D-xylulose-5-phosphate reductoisomerase [Planctomycetes bacterium]|nr:1-deoxy-D-xylulose-5-phosphate reductoisomerase [Planctomycetota bacterium]